MTSRFHHPTSIFPIILVALALLIAAPGALAGEEPLDGQTFNVEMGKKGSDEGSPNTLTFLSGTFLSAVCVDHDFPQAVYDAERMGDAIEFTVDAQSYSKGHMQWQGTVEGDRIEATATWHRPDKDEPIEFWIRSTEK